MTKISRNVVVVGAGIIGLTTAIRLAEAGHNVTVVAEHNPSTAAASERDGGTPMYTSSGSGGLWKPFLLSGEDVKAWSTATLQQFEKESTQVGVRRREGFVLNASEEPELPWYADLISMTIKKPSDDPRIPSNYIGALHFNTLVVQMEKYLPYLQTQLEQLNVSILTTASLNNDPEEDTLWSLAKARQFSQDKYGNGTILVNCAGIGASYLSDEIMIPGRGILVHIRAPPGKDYCIAENILDSHLSKDGLLAYCIPMGDDHYILGGTFLQGDYSLSSTLEERNGVVERALSILQVDRSQVQVTGTWTGLRPVTSLGQAIVGIQDGSGGDVIANFGHGGSGVTTCWGCADQVVSLVDVMHMYPSKEE